MPNDHYTLATKVWIEKFVIGLNLCPFAKRPFLANQINYLLNLEDQTIPIVNDVLEESLALVDSNKYETSFVIVPKLKLKFEFFYDFVRDIESLCERDHEAIKLVAFHPGFKYKNSSPNDTSNATNRSPYPMIHLLKESSLKNAMNSAVNIDEIPLNNQILLMGMTWKEIHSLYDS